jgi:hypothetical protein
MNQVQKILNNLENINIENYKKIIDDWEKSNYIDIGKKYTINITKERFFKKYWNW